MVRPIINPLAEPAGQGVFPIAKRGEPEPAALPNRRVGKT